MRRRIYVASSWRNPTQQQVVHTLRRAGHDVYDFRNPQEHTREVDGGFHWSDIDPAWQSWTAARLIEGLDHPLAKAGFLSDFEAMQWADTCLLVMPCGRSAHLELGWSVGAGKHTAILFTDGEPELMIKMVNRLLVTTDEVLAWLDSLQPAVREIAS